MSEQRDTLQQYVSDMLAVEQHIHEAVRRQKDDDRVKKHSEASALINRIEATLDEHIEALEQHLSSLGGDEASPIKNAVTAVAGLAAGLYDKVRSDPVSKMLRDDYTALSLAAMGYTMLHTTGLALTHQPTAAIALNHLAHWTPLIVEISEVIPLVVVKELVDEGAIANSSIAREAVKNTQQCWTREATI